jgi:hypothetical protein
MVLIVMSHLLELIRERAHAGFAVNELEVSAPLIVQMCVVDDACAGGRVEVPRELQRPLGLRQSVRPSSLVERPNHRARLTDDSSNAIEEHRLRVAQVMQQFTDAPFVRSISSLDRRLVQIKSFKVSAFVFSSCSISVMCFPNCPSATRSPAGVWLPPRRRYPPPSRSR